MKGVEAGICVTSKHEYVTFCKSAPFTLCSQPQKTAFDGCHTECMHPRHFPRPHSPS